MTAEDTEPDSTPTGFLGAIRKGLRWLRELHRGYAYTGHLPRRKR